MESSASTVRVRIPTPTSMLCSIYTVQIIYLSRELDCEKNENEQKEAGRAYLFLKIQEVVTKRGSDWVTYPHYLEEEERRRNQWIEPMVCVAYLDVYLSLFLKIIVILYTHTGHDT